MAPKDSQLPIDTAAPVPPAIQAAAAAADALHAQIYGNQTPQPEPAPQVAPPAEPQPTADLQPAPQPTADLQPAPQPQPTPQPQPAPAPDDTVGTAEHEHQRYLAMKGRVDQAHVTIGSMQEQMAELGDELIRTQALLRRPAAQTFQPNTQTQPPRQRAVTQADIDTYGPELVDMARRAALDAVRPEIDHLAQQTRQVHQQVRTTSVQGIYQQLDQRVPNWKQINQSPRFKIWCSQRDIYSGAVRGQMLNAAFQAVDAPRVLAFFEGFLAEEQATGNLPSAQPEPAPITPPRQAAIPLDSLTAPGRAKPASGDIPSAADKPVYTRAQIANFYSDVRRGVYVGRDEVKAQTENAIFQAQRDGRVRG